MNVSARWRSTLWMVVPVAVVAVFIWRANAWSPPTGDRGVGSVDAGLSSGLTSYPDGQRQQVPPLAGATLDGDWLDLADLSGHVVVVNVWGSWCVPCRAEAPDLARVARETADRGVRFVGIDTRDTLDAAMAFVRNFNIPYPSIVDQDSQKLLAFSGIIPISAVPSTIVIDAQGQIAAKVVGRVEYATLRGLVDDVLAENLDDTPSSPAHASHLSVSGARVDDLLERQLLTMRGLPGQPGDPTDAERSNTDPGRVVWRVTYETLRGLIDVELAANGTTSSGTARGSGP